MIGPIFFEGDNAHHPERPKYRRAGACSCRKGQHRTNTGKAPQWQEGMENLPCGGAGGASPAPTTAASENRRQPVIPRNLYQSGEKMRSAHCTLHCNEILPFVPNDNILKIRGFPIARADSISARIRIPHNVHLPEPHSPADRTQKNDSQKSSVRMRTKFALQPRNADSRKGRAYSL